MSTIKRQPNAGALPLLKPRALQHGDRVGLVCPGSRPASPAVVRRCSAQVEAMGFKPVVGKHVLKTHGYMAGADGERLEDLVAFLEDDTIAAIFCITGGFGAIRLLSHLDYSAIAKKPKVIVGCDDNTHLLLAIHARSGLVTFHGPNLDQINSQYSFDRLQKALTIKAPLPTLTVVETPTTAPIPLAPYAPVAGRVEGRLIGGNLTALISLLGTPLEPDFRDTILFLEDKNERNDILDRWLTTLWVAGKLDQARGVIFGQFPGCGAKTLVNSLSLEDLFGDRLESMAKPCCFGFPIGQAECAATVPIGTAVALDTTAGMLEFAEPALV